MTTTTGATDELMTIERVAVLQRVGNAVVQQLRQRDDLLKPPGVAETLDWARALTYLGTTDLDLASAATTLGALLKYREDAEVAAARGFAWVASGE